jgi:hypothetical protein
LPTPPFPEVMVSTRLSIRVSMKATVQHSLNRNVFCNYSGLPSS